MIMYRSRAFTQTQSLDLIDYGTGEGPDPTTFTTPIATTNPLAAICSGTLVAQPRPAIQAASVTWDVGVN